MTQSARLIAQLALFYKVGPSDLLAAPPSVIRAMIDLIGEQNAQRQQEDQMNKLRAALSRG